MISSKGDLRLKHLSYIFHSFAVFFSSSVYVSQWLKTKSDSGRRQECMLLIQVSLCHILKHLEDTKALSVYIYYTWCDVILIFKLHGRTRFTPRSSMHSLTIRITSDTCL